MSVKRREEFMGLSYGRLSKSSPRIFLAINLFKIEFKKSFWPPKRRGFRNPNFPTFITPL